jgi:hypothetical protein
MTSPKQADELLKAIVDIWDDGPDGDNYQPGSLRETIEEAREYLAQPPSAPPEAGKVQSVNQPFERIPQHAADPGFGPVPPIPKVVDIRAGTIAEPPSAQGEADDERVRKELACVIVERLWGLANAREWRAAVEDVLRINKYPRHPSPVAQGAGVTLAEHTKHVSDFLNELYATMIDPCVEGTMTVKETCDALLKAAVEQREQLHALRHPSHPTGSDGLTHATAQEQIQQYVRQIQILSEQFGYDPTEWLQDEVAQ